MPEYESSRKHFSPKDRWTFIGCFVFWVIPTVGSYMAFGGDIWLTRLLTYGAVVFGALVVVSFIDARLQAAERRRHMSTGDTLVCLGSQNWFWSSDRDPGGSGGAA